MSPGILFSQKISLRRSGTESLGQAFSALLLLIGFPPPLGTGMPSFDCQNRTPKVVYTYFSGVHHSFHS